MFVFSNLAISVDGKIAPVDRRHFPLGTALDRREMQRLRKKADAVLMGASTLRAWKGPLDVKNVKKQPANIIMSRALERISPTWEFFDRPDIQRILYVSERPTQEKAFAAKSQVAVLKPLAAREVVKDLKLRGFKSLLVEGGGGTMWDFVKDDLIDEFHITLTPKIVGGAQAPTLVDGSGFTPEQVKTLKLKKAKKVGNEIYLVYSR